MQRVLYIGKCGIMKGIIVGGEIGKNRTILKYLSDKYDVKLIDTYAVASNMLNKTIRRLWILAKLLFYVGKSEWIVIGSYEYRLQKILHLLRCSKKIKFFAVGKIVDINIIESGISVEKWNLYNGIFVESEKIVEKLHNIDINNARYLTNCKFLPVFPQRKPEPVKNVLSVFYHGQVRKEKGIDFLIEGICLLNKEKLKFELYLYGDVYEGFEYLLTETDKIPKGIYYCGVVDMLSSTENYSILRDYDIFAFPTEWKGECIAGSLIDALALGKPIIATNHNMNAEIVNDGVNGFLFEKRSMEQFCSVMNQLYENQSILVEMGNESLKNAEKFRIENVFKDIAGL